MAARRVKAADQFLPGLEPGTPAAAAMYRDTDPPARRRRRARGPWKKPARVPCDFTAKNGVRCELESIRGNRCALHPLNPETP